MPSARLAVFVVFFLNGAVFVSWASRVPALADQIGAANGQLGLSMAGASLGLVLSTTVAGRLCSAFGARPMMICSGLAGCLLLPVVGLVAQPWQFAGALFLLGFSNGLLDVAMNVAAMAVVRSLDRPVMPFCHAGFSVGGLVGSAGGALAAGAGWSPLRHFVLAAVVGIGVTALVFRGLPGARPQPDEHAARMSAHPPCRRPVLWLLAAVGMCSAIGEGATSDWSALFLARDRGLSDAAAAVGLVVFSVTMAITRLVGEQIQRRWGPYRMLTAAGVIAAIGMFTASVVPSPVAGYLGFALVGVGLASVFPVALSLAGHAGERPDGSGGEREIGFVTGIAYASFLAGPPLVGGLAQLTSLPLALGIVAGCILLMVPATQLAARVSRPTARQLAEAGD